MIGYIEGTVRTQRTTHCIVVAGGIGYKVFATKETLAPLSIDQTLTLWTHLVVREDVLDLYGFISEEELQFFELLLTVSGIGPKGALGILDLASIEVLQQSIMSNNASYLTSVSGIGKKTAEKIVLGLKDKMSIESVGEMAMFKIDVDNLEAMRALGYSAQEAREALREVPTTFTSSNDRLREALRLLGAKR